MSLKRRSYPRLPVNAWIEISLHCKKNISEYRRMLHQFFLDQGFQESEHVCLQRKSSFCLSVYLRSWKKCKKLQKAFQNQKISYTHIRVKVLGPRDWLDKWKLNYHAQPLGRSFLLVPAWEEEKVSVQVGSKRLKILLDPKSAFGSGTHETTKIMIQFIEQLAPQTISFLDVGVGSGILSVAARKLGVEHIDGFDKDEPSVNAANQNMKRNGFCAASFIAQQIENYPIRKKYDFVSANVLSKVLIENQAKLGAWVKPGKYLAVSGISKRNFLDFRKQFKLKGFRCLKVITSRSWVGVLYKKQP